VPDLVAVAADVVLPRTTPLGAADYVDVDTTEVRGAQQRDVGHRGREGEGVPEVVEEDLVYDHMAEGDEERDAKAGVHHALVGLVAGTVDPLCEAGHEADDGDEDGDGEVEDGQLQLAVHAVVQRREGAPRNQQVDPRVVETVSDEVGAWIGKWVRLDMGWKRWKMVLHSRQIAAVVRKSTIGHREIECGLGASPSSMNRKSSESISSLN
jgi:hypothetical protein